MSETKVITTQFKLIEMSQTRARGACTRRDLKGMSYGKQNCLSLYSFRYLKTRIKEITYPFYSNSSISTLSLTLNTSELFTWFLYRLHDSLSCSLEVKKSSCQLFVWMQFVFNFLVSFFFYSVPFEKANIIRLESYS